jgi:hypothetical protein
MYCTVYAEMPVRTCHLPGRRWPIHSAINYNSLDSLPKDEVWMRWAWNIKDVIELPNFYSGHQVVCTSVVVLCDNLTKATQMSWK